LPRTIFTMSVLLSIQDVTKGFGLRPLFTGLSMDLRANERIGLIGPNGAGKSTLLRILAGLESPDEGSRTARRGVRIGYVAQDDSFATGQSVRDALVASLASESIEEHERDTRIAITLKQVGFADSEQLASNLSGGWRKRLALARAIVCRPEFLLLDEPTNHLDLPGVVWLERFLRSAPFSYLAATHDRAFLRAVADDIVEVSRVYPSGTFRVTGSYDEFQNRRDEFMEAQVRQQESVANQVRKETEWLGRSESAQRRKSKSRIAEAAKRREELADLKYRNASAGAAEIDFAATGRASRKLLAATGVFKSLAGRTLFAGLDLIFSPGTKLGLLGPNGSGKSALLRVLSGEIEPDAGVITRAEGLRVVTFEQGRANRETNVPLRKALAPTGDTVLFNGQSLHVAAWATRFLFRPDQMNVPVSELSGGEQARVRLAQLMLQPADLLLLDEPTNDLDIPALEALEESLAEFPGAIVLVSHDRELTDRLCTEVIGLDGRGGAASYASVSQWLAAYEKATEPPKPAKAEPIAPQASAKPRKLSYKEQLEWEGMEAAILAAEADLVTHQAAVEESATAGHAVLAEACRAMEASQKTVERLYARWAELEEKRRPKGG
jgi:ATP-binding cassette subfamily F protein uup